MDHLTGTSDRRSQAEAAVGMVRDAIADCLASASTSPIDAQGQTVAARTEALPELMALHGIRSPLLVVDSSAVRASGMGGILRESLEGCAAGVFNRFMPNPSTESAVDAARQARRLGADGVVSVGGGSCCDVAKGAALGAPSPGDAEAVLRNDQPPLADPLPLVAIPTTSGSGSEATGFAALYVGTRKVSIWHPRLTPRCVVLDERLHAAMPRTVAASAGLDALSHALESLWAVGSTDESLAFARAAGPLIAGALAEGMGSVSRLSRQRMMIGAYLAGRAIGVGRTTAAHALAYGLTMHLGLAHGHAVALSVGRVAAWNAEVTAESCVDPRGTAWVADRCAEAAALLGTVPERLPGSIENLLRVLGLPSSPVEAGATHEIIRRIAEGVDPIRLSNNPRRLSVGDAARLLSGSCVPDRLTRADEHGTCC